MVVRSIIMQLIDLGVTPESVPATLSTVLNLAGLTLECEIHVNTVYNIKREMGLVTKAHLAQEWLSSAEPTSVINQSDGTTSKGIVMQVR